GHSQTGACNADDLFSLVLQACLLLGAAPELDAEIHLTPVDFVSRAVVELSRSPSTAGKAFHLMNPVPVTWQAVVEALRASGSVKRALPYDRWHSELSRRGCERRERAVELLCGLLSGARPPFPPGRRRLSQDNTSSGLAAVPAVRYPEHSS